MDIIFALFMLGAGGGLAAFVLTAMAIARKENEGSTVVSRPQRDSVAASILFHVVAAGGVRDDEALRQVRRGAGLAAPVTRGIDVANWAESYARVSSPKERAALLETAVQLVAARSGPVPLRQYAALLDLGFGLGFQTDALAKLRQTYGFDYIDHAKDTRPHERGIPERARPHGELLQLLGLEGTPTRQELSSAYRRLVALHHPDRFHGGPAEARNQAATRFIEITRAYEELLQIYRD